jgi:signal transduction histidine kinase
LLILFYIICQEYTSVEKNSPLHGSSLQNRNALPFVNSGCFGYDNQVRTSESPFLADWFAISLRWLVIFGLVISLTLDSHLTLYHLSGLGLPILWNAFNATLAVFNRRLAAHRIINLLADLIATMAIFILADGINGPLIWVGALAIMSGALYYEIRGTLLMAIIVSALEVGYTYFFVSSNIPQMLVASLVGLNLAMALISGALSYPLLKRLRQSYQSLQRQRRESEQRVQLQERNRMKALFSMVEAFSATLNYQTVLQSTLDISTSALGVNNEQTQYLLRGFLLFTGHNLRLSASRGFPVRDQNLELPAEEGVLHEVLQAGEGRLIRDPHNDPELGKFMGIEGCAAALCIPLLRGMNAFGVLLLAHPQAEFFTEDRIDLLEMIGHQAVIAIQNARLFQDLSAEKERIVNTQEEAQKKLARDLHDGPTQSVSAIAMRLSIARKMLERNPKEAVDELVKIEDLARRTTQEIRHMLFTLRPLVLENEGLIAALNTMADKVKDLYGQKVIVDADSEVVNELDMSHQTVIFYLSEEAINNARKHAEAGEITLRLKFVPNEHGMALLEVSDNGKGFNVQEVLGSYDRRGSMGMVNLRERTDLINGLLKVDSVPGRGTRVRVFIPLNEEAIDRLHRAR